MFKFEIGEKVLYQDVICKIETRTLVESKYGSIVFYKLDNGISNVKESKLKPCPKYTITIEDNLCNKNVYHVDEILGVANSTVTFTPGKIQVGDKEIDKILGIKFLGGLHE